VATFEDEEIRRAVWDYDNFKSSGSNGVNFGFIKEFWHDLKANFIFFFHEVHNNARLVKVELQFHCSYS
jgi:hypothetical protein